MTPPAVPSVAGDEAEALIDELFEAAFESEDTHPTLSAQRKMVVARDRLAALVALLRERAEEEGRARDEAERAANSMSEQITIAFEESGVERGRSTLPSVVKALRERAERAEAAEANEFRKRDLIQNYIERTERAEARASAAEAECERLRGAGQAVVDAYRACRDRNSMSGFWTHLDDLAAELDGRAEAARRADAERRALSVGETETAKGTRT